MPRTDARGFCKDCTPFHITCPAYATFCRSAAKAKCGEAQANAVSAAHYAVLYAVPRLVAISRRSPRTCVGDLHYNVPV